MGIQMVRAFSALRANTHQEEHQCAWHAQTDVPNAREALSTPAKSHAAAAMQITH
jgi:selenocysteine lyase/cysteine desulfurase